MPFSTRALSLTLALTVLSACSESSPPAADPTPALQDLDVRSRGDLVVAADVSFACSGYTETRVRYRVHAAAGDTVDAGADDAEAATPVRPIGQGNNVVTVLGLLADTPYEFDLELLVNGDVARTEKLFARTAPLPDLLASVRLETSGDLDRPGLVLADVPTPEGRVLVAFDSRGRIRWYFETPLLGNFSQRLDNGNFGAFVGTTTGWQPTYGYFLEVTPLGEVVARHQAPPPLYTDEHDLVLHPDGNGDWSATLLSYDIRTVDLAPYGGRRDARIAAHQILRYGADGALEFLWNGWDHISFLDLIEPVGQLEEADLDHPNSVAFDTDGDYVVSFRNLSQVMKIDSATGSVLWRLGGRLNEFEWRDDPWNGFSAQHSVVPLANGHLLVFDNGTSHRPSESRAVEYELDVARRQARMVWQYRHQPAIYTAYTGSVQRLDDGHTVVGFAFAGVVTEVDASGSPVWEGRLHTGGTSTITYRMKRIGSLYDGL